MEEGKKEYEIAYLVLAPEQEQEVVSVLKQNGAEIINQKTATSVALAYKIKHHASASLGVCQFRVDGDAIKSINEVLKLNKNVLRFLIVTPPIKPVAATGFANRGERGERTERGEQAEKKPAPAGAISNEALSEKLEEILK